MSMSALMSVDAVTQEAGSVLGPSGMFVICGEPDGTPACGCEGPGDVAHAATAAPRIAARANRDPTIFGVLLGRADKDALRRGSVAGPTVSQPAWAAWRWLVYG